MQIPTAATVPAQREVMREVMAETHTLTARTTHSGCHEMQQGIIVQVKAVTGAGFRGTTVAAFACEVFDMKRRRQHADAEETDVQPLDEAVEQPPGSADAPEVDPQTADLVAWDEPPGDTAAPRIEPDDEAPLQEMLVEEGLEEAERDRRIAAADPDFEP